MGQKVLEDKKCPFSPASGEKVPKADEGVVTDVDEMMTINPRFTRKINRPLTLTLSPAAGKRGPNRVTFLI